MMRRAEAMPPLVRHDTCAKLLMALQSRQADLWAAPAGGPGVDDSDVSQCRPEVAVAGWHFALSVKEGVGRLADFPGMQMCMLGRPVLFQCIDTMLT